jgi:hypothetical protein
VDDDELTDVEMAAFADRLEVFGRNLPSREEAFLRRVLRSLPRRDGVVSRPVRTVHDLITTIDQSYLSPDDVFTPNPQPTPPSFRLTATRGSHTS